MFQFRPALLISVALFCLQIGSTPAHGANSVVTKAPSVKSASKAALDPKAKKMWVLKLRTSSVGMIICYASQDKFLAESSIASFLSSPTNKGACVIYNDVKKLYVEMSSAEIKSRLNSVSRQGAVAKRIGQNMGWQYFPPKCVGSEMLKGMHTKVYTQENIFPMSFTSKHVVSRTSYLDQAEFSQMPEGVAMVISKIAKSRSVDRRIALRETIHMFTLKKDGSLLKDEGTRSELDLVSLKAEPYDATKFVLPKDYRRSPNWLEVLGVETVDGRRNY